MEELSIDDQEMTEEQSQEEDVCCPWCHEPVDTKFIFEKYYSITQRI